MRPVNWLSLVICAAAFGVAAYLYPQLPERMPIHWNAAGVPNGYAPRALGAFLCPLTLLVLWALLAGLPRVAPRGYKVDKFAGAYGAIQLGVMAVLFALSVIVLLAATGVAVHLDRLVPLCIGLFMLILGNYMGKLRKNFFMGIRTPWTLANDEVWARTHRLGGWTLVLGGLVVTASAVLGPNLHVFTWAVLFGTMTPIIASYFFYRKLVGFGGKDED